MSRVKGADRTGGLRCAGRKNQKSRDAGQLRPYIPVFQQPYGNHIKDKKEYQSGQQKGQAASGQCVGGFVGIHTHQHQGIRPVQSKPLVGNQHSEDTSHQSDTDRNGKAADDHGQQKLHGADGRRCQRSTEQPEQDLRREEAGKTDEFAAGKVEDSHPELCQQSDPEDDRQFSEVETGNGDRGRHQYIPVIVKVFQTPEIRTVKPNQRRIEKAGVEQGELSPERIPAFGQDGGVL